MTGKAGRNVTVAIGFCVDITYYIVCLCWNPTENSVGVVYFIFICVGISDGFWQPLVNGIYKFNLMLPITAYNTVIHLVLIKQIEFYFLNKLQ